MCLLPSKTCQMVKIFHCDLHHSGISKHDHSKWMSLSTSGVCLSWGSDTTLILVKFESGGSQIIQKLLFTSFPAGWLWSGWDAGQTCQQSSVTLSVDYPLFHYYKGMGKGEHPFSASSILRSGSLSLTTSFRTSEDNLKNMRTFDNQKKKNCMCWYNGLKCRCHYVQCRMLNENSGQHRLHSSFYFPALFANSHGYTLLCAAT